MIAVRVEAKTFLILAVPALSSKSRFLTIYMTARLTDWFNSVDLIET